MYVTYAHPLGWYIKQCMLRMYILSNVSVISAVTAHLSMYSCFMYICTLVHIKPFSRKLYVFSFYFPCISVYIHTFIICMQHMHAYNIHACIRRMHARAGISSLVDIKVQPDVEHRTRHALFIHPGKLMQSAAIYTLEAEHAQRELLLTYYIDILMFAGMHACMHMHAYIHTYIRSCIHTYMHSYIHTSCLQALPYLP